MLLPQRGPGPADTKRRGCGEAGGAHRCRRWARPDSPGCQRSGPLGSTQGPAARAGRMQGLRTAEKPSDPAGMQRCKVQTPPPARPCPLQPRAGSGSNHNFRSLPEVPFGERPSGNELQPHRSSGQAAPLRCCSMTSTGWIRLSPAVLMSPSGACSVHRLLLLPRFFRASLGAHPYPAQCRCGTKPCQGSLEPKAPRYHQAVIQPVQSGLTLLLVVSCQRLVAA